ncbi:MAG: hypothetical protein V4621_07985 [Pseudomonadota bacterium]
MATMNIAESIAAELTQAQTAHDEAAAAVVHYKQKIDRLTKAQHALTGILTEDDMVFQVKGSAPRQAKPESGPKTGNPKLPKTDAAFWMKHITKEPQSNDQILAAAAAEVGIDLTDAETKTTLKNRLATYLKNFCDDKSIQSSGERRERKYYL